MRVEGFSKISATPRPASAREESGAAFSSIARSSNASSSAALSSAPVRKWGGTVRQFMGPVALVCADGAARGWLRLERIAQARGRAPARRPARPRPSRKRCDKRQDREASMVPGKINYASPPANAPVQSGVDQDHLPRIRDRTRHAQGEGRQHAEVDQQQHRKVQRQERGRAVQRSTPATCPEGGTFELKLDKPGTIHYECTSYPTTMNGSIEVVE